MPVLREQRLLVVVTTGGGSCLTPKPVLLPLSLIPKKNKGCLGEAGYSQGTHGTFRVCGGTPRVRDEVEAMGTDPSSVILTRKRRKALSFLRRAFSGAQISCSSTAEPGIYLAFTWSGHSPDENPRKAPYCSGDEFQLLT